MPSRLSVVQKRDIQGLLRQLDDQLNYVQYPFDGDHLILALQSIVEGRFSSVESKLFPSQRFAANLLPPDHQLMEDVPLTITAKSVCKTSSVLEQGEHFIDGETMVLRSITKGANKGLWDLKLLLRHQELIPRDIRNKVLVFPGTVLLHPKGYLCIPTLRYVHKFWRIRFRSLSGSCNGQLVFIFTE